MNRNHTAYELKVIYKADPASKMTNQLLEGTILISKTYNSLSHQLSIDLFVGTVTYCITLHEHCSFSS